MLNLMPMALKLAQENVNFDILKTEAEDKNIISLDVMFRGKDEGRVVLGQVQDFIMTVIIDPADSDISSSVLDTKGNLMFLNYADPKGRPYYSLESLDMVEEVTLAAIKFIKGKYQ